MAKTAFCYWIFEYVAVPPAGVDLPVQTGFTAMRFTALHACMSVYCFSALTAELTWNLNFF